jgi:peptidoglycan/xylan/chitin deacetylase (PgdA/CDA1 family)
MILGYHEFSETPERDVYAITRKAFARQVALISRFGSWADCVTFDDAHCSQFAIAAPLLDQKRISAIFFVATAWVGCHPGVMSWRQLRELYQAGHTIGSHTHTHPMLTACRDAALRNELRVSRQMIEDLIGDEVSSLSIPSGRVDDRVLAACAEAGYTRVYTSAVGEYQPASATFPEVMGRFIVRRGTSDKTVMAYLKGEPATCRRLRIESAGKRAVKALVGDMLYQRAWRYMVRSKSYGS